MHVLKPLASFRGWALAGVSLLPFFFSGSALAQGKLISEGEKWRYFKGKEEPPADWNTLGFDDSSWLEGATPIGYSTDIPYKTTLTDMLNGYLSVYTRKKFTLSQASSVKGIKIRMKYDDGFVAYINGNEILRKGLAGAPGTPVPHDEGATDHETNTTFEDTFFSCDNVPSLNDGENVLAVQGNNRTLDSSDFSLDMELEAPPLCPTVFTCQVQIDGSVRLGWRKPTTAFVYENLVLTRNGTELTPSPAKNSTSYVDRSPVAGVNTYKIIATVCGADCSGADALTCSATVGGNEPMFRRGDADDNGSVNLTDAVAILNHLFKGGNAPTCLDAADSDDNGQENLTDAVFILQGLFQGGPPPPAPGRESCGVDPTTDDSLAACVYNSC